MSSGIESIGNGGTVEAGDLFHKATDAVVDGHDLAFNIGDGGDAVLDVELVGFDVASARLGDFELVHLLCGF